MVYYPPVTVDTGQVHQARITSQSHHGTRCCSIATGPSTIKGIKEVWELQEKISSLQILKVSISFSGGCPHFFTGLTNEPSRLSSNSVNSDMLPFPSYTLNSSLSATLSANDSSAEQYLLTLIAVSYQIGFRIQKDITRSSDSSVVNLSQQGYPTLGRRNCKIMHKI